MWLKLTCHWCPFLSRSVLTFRKSWRWSPQRKRSRRSRRPNWPTPMSHWAQQSSFSSPCLPSASSPPGFSSGPSSWTTRQPRRSALHMRWHWKKETIMSNINVGEDKNVEEGFEITLREWMWIYQSRNRHTPTKPNEPRTIKVWVNVQSICACVCALCASVNINIPFSTNNIRKAST